MGVQGEPLAAVLAHLEAVAGAVEVPVNADLEDGYAVRPEDVARTVGRAARTGVAGLSLEDSAREGDQPLLALDLAADRVAAAREAIDRSGSGVLLTARGPRASSPAGRTWRRRCAGCGRTPPPGRTA